ncbi:uncharacterized protein EV422DRAFT_135244 [Fimicolochytrium jonesii]|uniref:uncharacterized protein n=1 Tax=Fimicolochytrium jonesii TaxID=1396493 RepID=UPI0022FF14E6|nr:uncharacterized protein EV422DRAFT_135244 [Fimicolochytrium jonesii]KAI8825649.1 hypothetical protein EV422DRAFT_135244 [Fimicolochytrium jonesii]
MPTIEELSDNIEHQYAQHQAAGPQAKHQDADKFIDDLMKTPLFMKTMPTEKDLEENETLAAIHSLIYDGTPEEIAMNFKNQGNESFKAGKREYKHAINYYTKGLEQKADNAELNATLYSNRAAVNLELGNYRKVLNDCAEAITLRPETIKAYYRSAKALIALDKLAEAIDCCDIGLKIDPNNAALSVERKKAVDRKMLQEETDRKRKEREERIKREEGEVQQAILSKGIKPIRSNKPSKDTEQPAIVNSLHSDHKIKYDAQTNILTFPVVFLYPEHSQSDLIAAFNEDDLFQAHLEMMFGDESPSWDTGKTYKPDDLEIYFEGFPNNGPAKLLRVGKRMTLGDVLTHPEFRVVDGVCTFAVVPKTSPYKKILKAKYKQRS